MIVCLFAGTVVALGQELLESTPNALQKSSVFPRHGSSQFAAPSSSDEQGALQWGPVFFHPHLLYRLSYGDGIQAGPGRSSKTVINEFSPGLLLDLGRIWKLDYTPTLRYYSSSRFQNGLDQAVNFRGETIYQDWKVGLTQSYASSSQPLVETGTQTAQESYTTGINADYRINQKMSLEMEVNQSFRSAQQFTSSRQWSTMDWLDYRFAPQFSGAIGLGGGFVSLSAGSDNTFEQLQGRIRWQAGEKLDLSLSGGFEDRQFIGSSVAPLFSPTFGLDMEYRLTEATRLSLKASRTVQSSLFQSQVIENTDVTAGIRQRLLTKLYLDVTGGYGLNSFQTTARGVAVNREDNLAHFSARLTAPFLKKGTATIFYRSNEIGSTQSGFSLSSTQVGIEIGYHF